MRGGFKTLRDEMLGRFAAVEDDLKNVKVELKDLKTDVGRIERKLNTKTPRLRGSSCASHGRP